MPEYLEPEDVDKLLKLAPGRAKRMARRGVLPAIILPDGTIRFEKESLQRALTPKVAATVGAPAA